MSRRIKSAEESAREDAAKSKQSILTLAADGTKPPDPRRQAEHYRRHLVDAHIVIGQLQERVKRMDAGKSTADPLQFKPKPAAVPKTWNGDRAVLDQIDAEPKLQDPSRAWSAARPIRAPGAGGKKTRAGRLKLLRHE